MCDVLWEFRVLVWCDLKMRVCRLFCCMVWHYGVRWCSVDEIEVTEVSGSSRVTGGRYSVVALKFGCRLVARHSLIVFSLMISWCYCWFSLGGPVRFGEELMQVKYCDECIKMEEYSRCSMFLKLMMLCCGVNYY